MKVQIKNQADEYKINFPVLMRYIGTGKVVLFSSEDSGVVIVPDEYDKLGSFETWVPCTNTDVWTKFQGVIELSND